MPLEEYRRKRRFTRTPEPAGKPGADLPGRLFVVQLHDARRLHYDFRLELEGVLKSWAVPKGPSLDPSEKRLAVEVEDHPLEYANFEGTIPEGEYGGGPVIVWDRGEWFPLEDPIEGLRRGKLKFRLEGEKLRGGWTLVRMKGRAAEGERNWLLLKERDDEARPLAEYDLVEELPHSVISGRTLKEVAAGAPGDGEKRSSKRQARQAAAATLAKPRRKPAGRKQEGGRPRRAVRRAATGPLPDPSTLPGAVKGPLPERIEPELPKLVPQTPEGDRWLHEIKFDGYRLLGYLREGRAALITRQQQDWTERFPTLAEAAAGLPVKEAIIDGEVVAMEANGISSFQALQTAFSEGREHQLVYYLFDLLYVDGYDLRKTPLEQRKAALAALMGSDSEGRIRYSEHFEGDGPEFFRQCCRMGLEGVVSKRRDAKYLPGRRSDWLKSKCIDRDDFIVGGFTEPSGTRRGLGSLLVGYYDAEGRLHYAGRVGTGFTERSLAELRQRLDRLEQKKSPFVNLTERQAERGTHWVKPELIAHVEFSSWTRDRMLRHPSFQGLREDRPPEAITAESLQVPERQARAAEAEKKKRSGRAVASPEEKGAPQANARVVVDPRSKQVTIAGVRLTNPDRVLYPDQGMSKQGLAAFYAEIADWVLPHVAGRPLTLVRCPQGRAKHCFYQKHAAAGTPETIRRIKIAEKEKLADYVMIDDVAGLISLVQMGVLELHPWGARSDDVEHPDRLTIDLDPDPAVAWSRVIEAARRVRDLLEELGLQSFLKTTGGKGLHVVLPIARRHDWTEAKLFTKALVERIAAESPDRYTTNMSKSARRGKIFLDYLRNERSATAVGAYSTRARPGAPVSVPLDWSELSPAIRSDHFNVQNLPGRLASLKRDPWAELSRLRQSITAAAKKKLGIRD